MKRVLMLSFILATFAKTVHAGAFYDSPQVSTPSPLATMGLAGTFSFYGSTKPGGKDNPPLVIGSTGGIYAANFLGIEMATGTFRNWMRSASATVTGQMQAGTFVGDGSGLRNLSTGGVVNAINLYVATTSLYTALTATSVSLSANWTSTFSTYTALTSTGVTLSRFMATTASSFTALSASTASIYTNLVSTGVSLSRLWSSALSSFTALNSTGIAFSNFVLSANSTMTALSISTNTLRLATATLQGFITALNISTTALGTSTATLLSRINSIYVSLSTISTQINELKVFQSTGQVLIAALSVATTSNTGRLNNGAVTVYNSGTLLGNMTTLSLSNNIYGSISGSTVTLISITTFPITAVSQVYVVVNSSPVLISTMVFSPADFQTSTFGVTGASVVITISGSSHTFTAWQVFSSMTASNFTALGNSAFGGNISINGSVTSSGSITSVSLSTYPIVALIQGNQVWYFTTRTAPNGSDKMLVIKDATGGIERMQLSQSSGNFALGGSTTTGLNGTNPSSKLDVVDGSVTIRGANAGLNALGLIRTTSGYMFPDGTVQYTASLGGASGGIWISSTAKKFQQSVSTIVFLGDAISSIAYVNSLASVTISFSADAARLSSTQPWSGTPAFTTATFLGFSAGVSTIAQLNLDSGSVDETSSLASLYWRLNPGTGIKYKTANGITFQYNLLEEFYVGNGSVQSKVPLVVNSAGTELTPAIQFGLISSTAPGFFYQTSIIGGAHVDNLGVSFLGLERMRFDNDTNGSVSFGRKHPTASVSVSTIASNVPIFDVSSDTKKFEVTGDSVTVFPSMTVSTINLTTIFGPNFSYDGSTFTFGLTGTPYPFYIASSGGQLLDQGGLHLFNRNYAGAYYNVMTFGAGPNLYTNGLRFGVQQFGSLGYVTPYFGLWDSGGSWIGGFSSSAGFEVGTNVGRNTLDIAGGAVIGYDATTSWYKGCGASNNQVCGATAPANGLVVQGNTLLGGTTEIAGTSKFSIKGESNNKYLVVMSTTLGFTGKLDFAVSTNGYVLINNVATKWPVANSLGQLNNDGSGNLTWGVSGTSETVNGNLVVIGSAQVMGVITSTSGMVIKGNAYFSDTISAGSIGDFGALKIPTIYGTVINGQQLVGGQLQITNGVSQGGYQYSYFGTSLSISNNATQSVPSSLLFIQDGSVTIRGAGAGLGVDGLIRASSINVTGTIVSTTGFVVGASTVTGILAVKSLPVIVGGTAVTWDSTSGMFSQAVSSRRYKENIQKVENYNAILGIEGKTFDYIQNRGRVARRDIGFIAEDFDDAGLTDVVNYNEDGQVQSLKYDRICVYLLEVIKDLNKRIEVLEAK